MVGRVFQHSDRSRPWRYPNTRHIPKGGVQRSCTMDWKEHYKRNLVSADEAVQLVRSGNTVTVAESYPEPEMLLGALGRPPE